MAMAWRTGSKVAPSSTDKQAHFKTTLTRDDTVDGNQPVDSRFVLLETQDPASSGHIHSKMMNFYDIVDQDERSKERRISEVFVGWLVESLPFRMTMLILILVNSLTIGIQTDEYLEENYGPLFLAMDKVFLTIFVLEIIIKWYHDFLGFWRQGWNIFDFAIITMSLLGPSLTFLSGSGVLRILRVLRALRSLKSISALRGLQIVVHTIIHSIPDMANIVALLLISMFIFAILGYSFFGDDCPHYFGSLGTTMFSLFICVTQDGWMGITEELKMCGNYILGALYLLVFITVGAFIFANLVVAVVVTNLEWAIAEQKEIEEREKPSHTSRPSNVESEVIKTVDITDTLHKLARHQKPLEIPEFNLHMGVLENYFLVISAMEDNLVEFKKLQDQLTEITQEVRTLSSLEEVSDDEVFGLSEMARASWAASTTALPDPEIPPEPRRRRFNSLAAGDALSDLISMNRHQVINSRRAHNLHGLISQLHIHPSSTTLRVQAADLGASRSSVSAQRSRNY